MKVSKFLLNFRIRAGKIFFKKIHQQFGGALRCFVSGGAPLDAVVEEDFTIWGFNVLQGIWLNRNLTRALPQIPLLKENTVLWGSLLKVLRLKSWHRLKAILKGRLLCGVRI